MARSTLSLILALSLFANAFSVPYDSRPQRDVIDNEINNKETQKSTTTADQSLDSFDDNDNDFEEDFADPLQTSASSGGSNIFSLLKLATAFLPSASGSSGSGGSSSANTRAETSVSPLWTLKLDILKAVLHFGTSILGLSSSTSSEASAS
ncbi:uncharacterized protein LOC101740784 [Bombyx mori]|uniref:Uncharacterized protein n=1 Tax=Bombyx mori TaxID=7091 RepID=A0A8R1WHI8_BOMMO|nr:uncharacterized protein LOC101740784 [Bombyx mori]